MLEAVVVTLIILQDIKIFQSPCNVQKRFAYLTYYFPAGFLQEDMKESTGKMNNASVFFLYLVHQFPAFSSLYSKNNSQSEIDGQLEFKLFHIQREFKLFIKVVIRDFYPQRMFELKSRTVCIYEQKVIKAITISCYLFE